ncbi:MAG TPA: ACT domain-containing protein [Bacilli bacterium]
MHQRRSALIAPHDQRYYLVHEDVLPEAVLKTIKVKQLLAQGEAKTIHDAVEKVGLSRSAFYKYKDSVHSLNKWQRERIVTISLDLKHQSGVLSQVLSMIAAHQGNVLTIHQTIPLQGMANVVITMDTSDMSSPFPDLMRSLADLDGVRQSAVIGQG